MPRLFPDGFTLGAVTLRVDADRRRTLVMSGALLWIGAALGYLLLEAIAAAAGVPVYSYANDYISALGVPGRSPRAALMNTAFYLQGSVFLTGGAMIAGARGPKALTFLTFAIANAVGNILVGTVHSSNAQAGLRPGWHVLGATMAIVGGNAAIVAGSSVLRCAGASRAYRALSLGLGAVGFTCAAGMRTDTSPATLPIGAWERGGVYSILIWQLFTGVYLLASPARRRTRQISNL